MGGTTIEPAIDSLSNRFTQSDKGNEAVRESLAVDPTLLGLLVGGWGSGELQATDAAPTTASARK